MKPKRPTTRMWYITYRCVIERPTRRRDRWNYFIVPIVMVSDSPACVPFPLLSIRAITARAAARRYIRNNLAFSLASRSFETDNICGPDYMNMEPEMLKRQAADVKRAKIEVLT